MKLIDADALRERVLYRKKPRNHMDGEAGAYDRGFNAGIFAASKEIDSAPTVSPDEVLGAGKWLHTSDEFGTYEKCSCCGKEYYCGPIAPFNYCPSCGAKMEASEDA